jgi:AcrR family transcriptional regulator
MAVKKSKLETDTSTEEKIKNAARLVFHKKGFAATRTRDIAEEAGINLALLNYYFRSKEKLFDIVMFETMQHFFKSIGEVFNNDKTTLDTKIEIIAASYIDLLTANPNIPLFLMSELKMQPDELVKKMGMKEIIMNSSFLKQFQQSVQDGKIVSIHPLHFMMNLMSMTIFPFVASPMIKGMGDLSQKQFEELMEQRKLFIPKWIKATLKAK